jgi:hypothetical protein
MRDGAKHDVAGLEERIKVLVSELSGLATKAEFEEMIKLIWEKGHTTPAEAMFVHGVVDSMLAQTRMMAGLKQTLLTGNREIIAEVQRSAAR